MTPWWGWLAANGLEPLAVAFGIVSVLLSVREHIWSWPTALVNVALFSVLFYQKGFYSDMALQPVYFVLSIYGWYEWLHGGAGRTALRVSRTPRRAWATMIAVGVTFWALWGKLMSGLPGSTLPYLDAATTTVSLCAQWMMTRKLLENWAVWIAVDVVYVAMFIYKGLYLTAFNYAIYLVLAVLGHIEWKRSLNAALPPATPATAT